jgi:hypothetical protein
MSQLRPRSRILTEGRLQDWAARGRAQRFDNRSDGRLSLAELSVAASELASDRARQHWSTALRGDYGLVWDDLVQDCPSMSEATRMFVLELLTVNLGRLRDEF